MACIEKPVEISKLLFAQERKKTKKANAYSFTTAEPIKPFAPVMKTRIVMMVWL
jgi:hypothetical protein